MKKLLFALSVVFAGCASESATDKLIREYMEKNLNDPSSYEAIETSKLDSAFYNGYDSEAMKTYMEMYDDAKFNHEIELSMSEPNTKLLQLYTDAMADASKQIEKLSKTHDWIGWKATHQYRAKNAMGALMKHTAVFVFNEDMTEIKSVEEK